MLHRSQCFWCTTHWPACKPTNSKILLNSIIFTTAFTRCFILTGTNTLNTLYNLLYLVSVLPVYIIKVIFHYLVAENLPQCNAGKQLWRKFTLSQPKPVQNYSDKSHFTTCVVLMELADAQYFWKMFQKMRVLSAMLQLVGKKLKYPSGSSIGMRGGFWGLFFEDFWNRSSKRSARSGRNRRNTG